MPTQCVPLPSFRIAGTNYLEQHLTTPVFGKDVVYDVPNALFMEQKKFVKVGLSMDNFRSYVGMIEEEVEDFMKTDSAFSVYQKNNKIIVQP